MAIDPQPDTTKRRFSLPWLAAGAVVLVLIAALVGWLVLRDSGEDEAEPQRRAPAELATAEDLQALARESDGPFFWAGPLPDMQYELSQTSDGRIYIRYLPTGVEAGDPRADFLTVGTYPQQDALEVLRQRGEEEGAELRELANGGVAVHNESTPTSVYLAYPRIPRLVEVFDPSAERARELAFSNRIIPVFADDLPPESTGEPVAATAKELRDAARGTDHPVYWLGPRSGYTYELTRLPNGQVYIRYLPEGVEVGDSRPNYDTVGTYPTENGLAAAKAAGGDKAESFDVPEGGKAYYSKGAPTNVHFSFPKAKYHVEVFSLSAAQALHLVESGEVVPIR